MTILLLTLLAWAGGQPASAPAPSLDDIVSRLRASGVLQQDEPADTAPPERSRPTGEQATRAAAPTHQPVAPAESPPSPRSLVPPRDEFGLPAAEWVFRLLLPLTYFLHIVFMNMTLGTALLAPFFALAARNRPHVADALTRLLKAWPVHVSLTITTGVAPLLFVQALYGHLFYTANILLGWRWLAILGLLLVAFYSIYVVQRRALYGARESNTGPGAARASIAPSLRFVDVLLLLLVALCLLAIAWLFTANATLMLVPGAWADAHARPAAALNPHPMTLPRFLHNVIGALAVCSLGLAVMARCARGIAEDRRRDIISLGLMLACGFTLLQIASGVWFLAAIWTDAAPAFHRFTPGTVLWGLAVLSGILALAALFNGLNRPERPASVWLPTGLIGFTLAGMSAGRERVRAAFVDRIAGGEFTPSDVHPQTVNTVLFFVVLLVGLAFVALLAHWTWQSTNPSRGEPVP